MTKKELLQKLAKRTELSLAVNEKLLNSLTDIIQEELAAGEKIQLVGFGTFEVKNRPERMGRNPKTGAQQVIEAKNLPVFKAGKTLKDAVNQGK